MSGPLFGYVIGRIIEDAGEADAGLIYEKVIEQAPSTLAEYGDRIRGHVLGHIERLVWDGQIEAVDRPGRYRITPRGVVFLREFERVFNAFKP
jgi:hypothetical protein